MNCQMSDVRFAIFLFSNIFFHMQFIKVEGRALCIDDHIRSIRKYQNSESTRFTQNESAQRTAKSNLA